MPWSDSYGVYFEGEPIPRACYRRRPQAGAAKRSEEIKDNLVEEDVDLEPPYKSSPAYKRLPLGHQALVQMVVDMPEGHDKDRALQHWASCEDKELGQTMLAALLEASSAIQARERPNIKLPLEPAQPESIQNLKVARNKAEEVAKRSRYAAEQAKLAELELRQRVALQMEAKGARATDYSSRAGVQTTAREVVHPHLDVGA